MRGLLNFYLRPLNTRTSSKHKSHFFLETPCIYCRIGKVGKIDMAPIRCIHSAGDIRYFGAKSVRSFINIILITVENTLFRKVDTYEYLTVLFYYFVRNLDMEIISITAEDNR